MPHIIVEYAEHIILETQVDSMLKSIHAAVADSGLFEAHHIKTRAYGFKSFTREGDKQPYIHVQARIKSGRDDDNKKRLAKAIVSTFNDLALTSTVVTVEVIDMHRESYSKIEFS